MLYIYIVIQGIAVLFVLTEAKTQYVYKSIWKKILSLIPHLKCNLRSIMMDYEKASMNAVEEKFPHTSVHGCWFHYCQVL